MNLFSLPIGIRYTLEILMACNLFVLRMKKRPLPWVRLPAGMAAALLIGFAIGRWFSVPPASVLFYLFWAVFVALAAPYVWFVCEVSWSKALYCVIFGFAIQHLSSELFGILEIMPALAPWLSLLYLPIYVGVYAFIYFWVVRKLNGTAP